MDYQKHYNQLIHKAITFPYTGYTEIHHILPRCMGGDNSKENLVRLSAKQHFVAHHLLFKIYGGSKLANAWYAMCRVGRGQEERLVNAKMFDKVKSKRSELLSVEKSGELNHFFGKKHSDESRARMSAAQKELRIWEKRSEAHQTALLASQKLPKSAEHKAKIGRKGLIMLQNVITGEIIRVQETDARVKSHEWINPRKLNPEPKTKCAHCDVVTTNANLKRWHNDKCKQRKTYED
jgi:hypothetical protein